MHHDHQGSRSKCPARSAAPGGLSRQVPTDRTPLPPVPGRVLSPPPALALFFPSRSRDRAEPRNPGLSDAPFPYNHPVSEANEAEPRIVPRSEHPISRRDISTNALKVLYRLHNAGYLAYLVGGSVRDLMLGRRPKDFDVGTDAKPNEIRRLFSNSRIIGRRFRLVHVFFHDGDDRRGLHLPARSGPRRAARRAGRAADHQRQHLRHPAGGRLPPRLHDQRPVLQHRRLLGDRLRRRHRRPGAAS